MFQYELSAYRWLSLFGLFIGHFRIDFTLNLHARSILTSDRNSVTEPNFRKLLSFFKRLTLR